MDYSITIPEQSVMFINLSGMIMISVLFVMGFIILKRYAAKIIPGFMGLLCYLLIVVVGTELITALIAAVPPFGRVLLGTEVSFCITRAVITAGLVHATRMLVVKFTDRNQDMKLGDALMGGLGIAVGQAVIIGASFIVLTTLASTVNTYGLEALLADVEQQQTGDVAVRVGEAAELHEAAGVSSEADELYAYVENIASIEPLTYLMQGISYTIDIIFQVVVLLLLYAVIKKGLPVFWHGIIAAGNFILELLSLFANYAVWDNYGLVLLCKLAVLVGITAAALRIDAAYLNGELRSFAKLKRKKDAMPKFNDIKNK